MLRQVVLGITYPVAVARTICVGGCKERLAGVVVDVGCTQLVRWMWPRAGV